MNLLLLTAITPGWKIGWITLIVEKDNIESSILYIDGASRQSRVLAREGNYGSSINGQAELFEITFERR